MAKRVDKPIRLYVLAIFIIIAYGLLPIVSVFPFTGGFLLVGPRFLPFNGSIQFLYGPNGEAPFILILISLFLCVFSAASALLVFAGIKEGRVAALTFVTLDVLWWTLLLILAIINNESPGQASFELATHILFPPIWLIGVWWNFTQPEIGAYYRHQSELQK